MMISYFRKKYFPLTKVIFLVIFVLALIVIFSPAKSAQAYDPQIYGPFICNYDGYFTTHGCTFSAGVFYGEMGQAWRGHITANVVPNGDTVGLNACLSRDGAMWGGDDQCWGIISGEGPNASVGFSLPDTAGYTNIGDNPELPFKYWIAEFYAKDAIWNNIYIWLDQRRVSIDDLSAPPNVSTNQQFDVCWRTSVDQRGVSNVYEGPDLSWDGAVQNPGQRGVGPSSCKNLTAGSSPGVIQISLENVWGPYCEHGWSTCFNQIPKRDIYVTVNQNAPGPFNLSSSECYDTGKFDLSWSVSSNATSYDVYKHAWSFGDWQYVTTTTATSFTAQEGMGTDWYFKVVAKNSAGSTDSTPDNLLGGNCPAIYECSGPSSQVCTSSPNACGQTSSGTQTRTCDTSTGAWSAWGACSAVPPALPPGYGNVCTSPANACGMTNSGTIQCDGSCSASPPPLSSCPATSVSISASPTSVAWNGSSTITWSSQNATSCTASGDWSGNKSTSGVVSTGALTQVKTYTYTLSCTGLNGTDTKSATVIVSPPVPTVSNVTAAEPNYCISGPAATINWTYFDPAGSPQSAYQVQISNTGSFNNPIFDSGKRVFNSNSFTTDQGILQFNTTYKARVRVWNGYDAVSSWSNETSSWKTPSYAYPQTNFTWISNSISENPSPPLTKPVEFTDQTVFGGNPNGRRWSWNFGDSGSSTLQNPSKTYSAEGTYYVTLTATDNANQSCSKTRGPLIIQKPIPRWREVAPK